MAIVPGRMPTRTTYAWFGMVVAFSLLGRWQAYHARADHCNLDGTRIVPIHRVDLVVEGQVTRSFCSIRCARDWPDSPPGARFQVRDEVTGEVLDSSLAWFVESSVVAVPARQDKTHAFKSAADAMEHVSRYGGSRIPDPFAEEAR